MAEDGKEHHVPAGGFKNPWPSFGFAAGLKDGLSMFIWDYDRKRSRVTAEVRAQLGEPLKTNTKMLLKPPSDQIQVTWVGHATFLVQFDKINVLTDPVWSERCSPSSIVGPKRFVPVPFPLKELPDVDVVVISHNHYDHLDENTVKALGNKPLYLVPLGLKSWFNSIGITNVVELDWWQEHKISLSDKGSDRILKAVCTPCQHFSGRGILDRNKTLWCSWVLEGSTKRAFFSGDTGFCTVSRNSEHAGGVPEFDDIHKNVNVNLPVCPAFEEIGKRYGPFDVAFIPIGAYSPRHFMSAIHCSPEDAVAIHKAVHAKRSIGMHWGTFSLTDEPILEPPTRLLKELARLRIDPSTFFTMKHGETKTL
ncbi:hypothetical protein O6H91_02G107600 [Diphasiastrum complanatum]|nr:hypothetical protein O6H91_02G107600 [Diphasiastrum complanatum]KAJ7566531.1 hypothetical protein O6H91_02G107600 [Diphasiastrum complanatum]KAJ7566532.1 hypothetical protein O6H91_02G107600 [Diphasiastrum complanatum]